MFNQPKIVGMKETNNPNLSKVLKASERADAHWVVM